MLDGRFDPIEPARSSAGENLGPRHGAPFLDFVDLLANPGAEPPVPEALRDKAKLSAATIALVRSHVRSLGLKHPVWSSAVKHEHR
jgi:hypothetical protein